MEKKVSQYLRMSSTNPTMIKLEKLFALAEDLQIRLDFDHNQVIVLDGEADPSIDCIQMVPIEFNVNDCYSDVEMSFPPRTDYKLIYENPVYTKQKAIELEEWHAARDAQEKADCIAKEKEEADRLAKAKKELEDHEKALLASLKLKYES